MAALPHHHTNPTNPLSARINSKHGLISSINWTTASVHSSPANQNSQLQFIPNPIQLIQKHHHHLLTAITYHLYAQPSSLPPHRARARAHASAAGALCRSLMLSVNPSAAKEKEKEKDERIRREGGGR
jgi:hypothetical protein